jgi:hypothetical protein
MLARHGTRGLTKYPITRSELRYGRHPPATQPILQQRIRLGLMHPHGDRRDGSQSRGIEAQKCRATQ